jgi:hypothetical protein
MLSSDHTLEEVPMSKRDKPSKDHRKAAVKRALPELKPDAPQEVKGGKGATTSARRQDPYKNFNF